MTTYEEGLIAVVDILGMKGVWSRKEPEEVIQNFSALTFKIQAMKSEMEDKIYGSFPPSTNLSTYSFSDTIIILLTTNDVSHAVGPFGTLMSALMVKGIDLGLYMRGSLSYGKFYRDLEQKSPIIIGPAIDEAAQWYDKAEMICVLLSKFKILDRYH